ncbi:MAG: CvpA family protein, partial [Odoribacter sp.]|nr:CvpA family protein [Odoribacter sp.]
IALAVTFLVVVMLICVLGKVLTKIVDMVSLGLVNKLLGTCLGIAKYFIILCVILLIVDVLDERFHFISEETKKNSLLFHPFLTFAQQIYNLIRF